MFITLAFNHNRTVSHDSTFYGTGNITRYFGMRHLQRHLITLRFVIRHLNDFHNDSSLHFTLAYDILSYVTHLHVTSTNNTSSHNILSCDAYLLQHLTASHFIMKHLIHVTLSKKKKTLITTTLNRTVTLSYGPLLHDILSHDSNSQRHLI